MDNTILIFTILGLTFVTALSQILLILFNSLKKPVAEEKDKLLEDSFREKSYDVIHDAQEKANKILTNAELKGIEFLSKQKLDIAKIEADYAKSIKELEVKLLSQFKISLENADKSYQGFLTVLQENLRQQEIKNQALMQEKTNKLIEGAQNIMSSFIMDINNRVKKQIDEELKVVRNELEVYKKHRLEIINKYIIDILERTLEQTLNQKLTLSEHSDLIFKALEQAKTEHKL